MQRLTFQCSLGDIAGDIADTAQAKRRGCSNSLED